MPIWGWVCIGLVGLLVAAVALFYLVIVLPYDRMQKRLMQDGQTVVARILLANPSLYDAEPPAAFEGAFVVFTRDDDASEQHLAFLGEVCERLKGFAPNKNDPDEQKISWALETQRTVGTVLRVPNRLTEGREVYFATPNVFRRMLPEGMLTRDYTYLRVLIDDQYREALMIEYPDAPTKTA